MMPVIRHMLNCAKNAMNLQAFVLMVILTAGFVHAADASSVRHDGGRPPAFSNYPRGGAPDPTEDAVATYLFFTSTYQESLAVGGTKNMALQRICSDGYFTERVVNCIRMTINEAVRIYLDEFEVMLNAYILGLVTLAITLFGGQILSGTVEKPGPAAFTLLLKIGAVLFFTDALGGFVPAIFGIMETMAGVAMSYISEGSAGGYLASCGDSGAMSDVTIWRRVDCIIQELFTGNVAADGTGYQVGVLWVLAAAIFWTTFLGPLVFFVMLAVFLMMFLLIIRCVYVFLAAYAFLSLLIIISPLIIPLALFKSTANYYNKWWRQFLSMLIQPMILFAYMSFVFALIDVMFFRDEPYSMARIIGANWQTPEVNRGMDADAINEKMDEYAREYNFEESDEQYINYRSYLENRIEYMAIGNVLIDKQMLIDIEVNAASNAVDGISNASVAGRVIKGGAAALDAVVEWGFNSLSGKLFPFEVARALPEGRTPWSFLMDLLKFFLVVMILMPLVLKFTSDIPRLIQALSSAIRTPGSVLPGERQVYGTIGAVKGGAKGAVRGAITGFVSGGGKKGAVVGAVEGGVREGAQGYKDAANEKGGGRAGGGLAGNEHSDNIHSQQGSGTDRKVLHGERAGGNGLFGGRSGSGMGGVAKELAFRYATRGKGGGGGGKGGGGAGGGGGGVKK